jgi:hypothetical protein
MKKLLIIGLPLVAISTLGAIAGGHAQALELSTDCAYATIGVNALELDIQVGNYQALYGGANRFAEGEFLTSTRNNVANIEIFPRKAQDLWLAKLVGRQPQGMEPWTATASAANAFLQQIESASITGDYSGAGSFGAELLSLAPEATKVNCTF